MMITTSWIWPASYGGVNGVLIDTDEGVLMWLDDAAGCACDDSAILQTYAQFHEDGPVYTSIPDDVLAEVKNSLAALEGQHAS